jgi:hypothetical protein
MIRNRFLVVTSLALLERLRANKPLQEVETYTLTQKIFESQNYKSFCGKMWANPDSVSADGQKYKECEDRASLIAISLKEAGLGDISSQNVKAIKRWNEIDLIIDRLQDEARKKARDDSKNLWGDWSKKQE